jgi:hypothetical protein
MSQIRIALQLVYFLLSIILINKLIVCCFSRLNYIYKIPLKLIKQGYKLFSIVDHGYIYN